jgi:hypothetical protein
LKWWASSLKARGEGLGFDGVDDWLKLLGEIGLGSIAFGTKDAKAVIRQRVSGSGGKMRSLAAAVGVTRIRYVA